MTNNPIPVRVFSTLLIALAVPGCGAKYGCPVPDGVFCKSMAEIYHRGTAPRSGKKEPAANAPEYATPEVITGPKPIRRAPKVIRIWFAPWVDQDEDLHQPGYIYAEIPERKWLMGEYVREAVIDSDAQAPLPPPVSQQRAMGDLDKERAALGKSKEPPAAPEGAPPLPDALK